MKHTTFLAAALVAGFACASSLESSNIVGYRTENSLVKGFTLITPSFLSAGKTAANINDLSLGNLGGYVNGEVNFQSLDAFGRAVEGSAYAFYGYEGMTGWYDGNFGAADKEFSLGEAVWMTLPGSDDETISPVSLTNSGEVNVSDVEIRLRNGFTPIGNMMAVNYPIADIEVGNVGAQINGEINFQSLDAFGRAVEGSAYAYYGYEGMTGWYDGTFAPASLSLVPGQGIWIASTAEGVTLKFYAPDL